MMVESIKPRKKETLKQRWNDTTNTKRHSKTEDPYAETGFGLASRVCTCGAIGGIAVVNIYSYCEQIARMTNNMYFLERKNGLWYYSHDKTSQMRHAHHNRGWMKHWMAANPDAIIYCASCGGKLGTVQQLLLTDNGQHRGVDDHAKGG